MLTEIGNSFGGKKVTATTFCSHCFMAKCMAAFFFIFFFFESNNKKENFLMLLSSWVRIRTSAKVCVCVYVCMCNVHVYDAI